MKKMKQTGIRWIGEIPNDWNTKRIKYMATLKGRIGWQGLTSEEYQDEGAYLITGVDFLDGGINWEQCEHIPMKRWEEARDIQIENGDLLITKDGTVGKVAIVSDMPGETSLNSGVLRIMPIKGYSRRFLYWVLQSEEFWNWFNFKNGGNSTIVHLYQRDFAEFSYAFPSFDEQESIADYLDSKIKDIDDIISIAEQEIAVLKTLRRSVITESVTKGLNKKIALKPSGTNWPGQIPVHWNVKRLKYMCSRITDGSHFSPDTVDEGYPYITAADVHGVGVDYEAAKKISEMDFKALARLGCRPNLGDVLLVKDGATTGRVGMISSNQPCVVLSSVAILSGNNNLNNKYLMYLLESEFMQSQIMASMAGSAMPRTILSKIMNYFGVDNPIDEQKEIVRYLDNICGQIDSVVKEKEENLNTLKMHRKSLIYEYVTGKKRIKGGV
ncbi:MAG: restriction endonuclease subunit S [Lachnospiraceae bacterium]|nr:restriction endonuclease subunit S [Lachnospiraceae bacterium]